MTMFDEIIFKTIDFFLQNLNESVIMNCQNFALNVTLEVNLKSRIHTKVAVNKK